MPPASPGSARRFAPPTSLLGRSLLASPSPIDLSRHDVTAWRGAPIRGVDNRRHRSRRGAGSRAAGVVAGLEQWESRLGRRRSRSRRSPAERDHEQEWRAEQLRNDASARALADFITTLARALQPAGGQPRGRAWRWCRSLVRTYLGGESLKGDWPPRSRPPPASMPPSTGLATSTASIPHPSTCGLPPGPRSTRRRSRPPRHRQRRPRRQPPPTGARTRRGNRRRHGRGFVPGRRRDDPLLPDRYRAVVGPIFPSAANSSTTIIGPCSPPWRRRAGDLDLHQGACAATPSEHHHAGCSTPPGPRRCGPPPSASLRVPASGSSRSRPSSPDSDTDFPTSVQEYDVGRSSTTPKRVARSPNRRARRPAEVRTDAELLSPACRPTTPASTATSPPTATSVASSSPIRPGPARSCPSCWRSGPCVPTPTSSATCSVSRR